MRLFCDANKRQLLRSVFETSVSNKENIHSEDERSRNKNKWLSTSSTSSSHGSCGPSNKKPSVISIDDSF